MSLKRRVKPKPNVSFVKNVERKSVPVICVTTWKNITRLWSVAATNVERNMETRVV